MPEMTIPETMRQVRFRTLGCYPLSGAVEMPKSSRNTLPM